MFAALTFIDLNFIPCFGVGTSFRISPQHVRHNLLTYIYIYVKIEFGDLISQQIKQLYLLCGPVRDVIYYALPLLQSGCYTDSVKLLVSTPTSFSVPKVYTASSLKGNSMKVTLKHEYTKVFITEGWSVGVRECNLTWREPDDSDSN